MKRYVVAALLLCFSSILFADEIYFKDGSRMKGKVILEGKEIIEFNQEGELKNFHFAKYDEVQKIVYDDGREIVFQKKPVVAAQNITISKKENTYDAIYLKNGTIVYGKVARVTPTAIEYDPKGEIPYGTIPRAKVRKIVYANSEEVVFDGEPAPVQESKPKQDQKQAEKTEKYVPSYHFSNAVGRIALIGAYAGSSGEFESYERDLYSDSGYKEQGTSMNHDMYYGGLEFDIMMPGRSVRYNFGLKSRLLAYRTDQNVYDDDYELEDSEKLFVYKSVQTGPLINLILNPDSRYLQVVVQSYFLYGRIFNGKYYAEPILRDNAHVDLDRSTCRTTFDGYTLGGGIGLHFIINEGLPLTVGANLNYTYGKIDFKDRVAAYDAESTSFDAVGLEFTVGIYF